MKEKNKKGGMEISFGMIFSIILIIAFIAVAFYVIKIFLNIKTCGLVGRFYQEFQASIDTAFRSPETSQVFSASLPSSVEYVCFFDVNKDAKGPRRDIYDKIASVNKNLVLWPKVKCSGLIGYDIKHVDISQLTTNENPWCVKTEKSKINLKIEKGIYDKSVKILKP
ncbi:MAG: hypothetical protein QXO70_01045 [Candidatus Pacearchaeota archaeon]